MGDLVVTGGLGLIGSAIVEAWEGEGATIVDDARGAVCAPAELRPRRQGVRWERPRWVNASVEEAQAANVRLAVGARAVIHCAAPVGPVGILTGSVLTSMVASTQAACRLAARAEAPLVAFSSSEVYGTTAPRGELVLPDARWSPRLEYAAGKIATELIVGRHYAETGLPTAIIRPWNVSGPRQSAAKGFVLPRWVDAAAAGEELTLYGDGSQARAFMAASDLADLVCELVDGVQTPPGAWACRPMDAATPENAVTLRELAELVSERVREVPIRSVDPVELHGPRFAEAAAGTKLPAPEPALHGWTTLERLVDLVAAGRSSTLPA